MTGDEIRDQNWLGDEIRDQKWLGDEIKDTFFFVNLRHLPRKLLNLL